MKCFFCYVEGVFSQYEFYDLVSGYFDRNNEDMLQTLKVMISNRDNARKHQNLLCKPLSEFDTREFKKISYSYYEISPKFPKPICGGRSDPEFRDLYEAVFNDIFTSLPQGSESFKFKYKNQYEDVLFRTEDEMFKMDHDIGNYRKTMKVLEEEKNKLDGMTQAEKEAYKLCPRKFNILRLKWIERTYAELGQEMLKLLPQSPARAIPIIYERFRSNYYRAIDDKSE
jgi:histone deacetylase complex regulatory component SIN3